MSIRFLSIVFCLTLCVPATVCAAEETSVPALGAKTGEKRNTGDFVVGYRFTLDKAMSVTALGVTDQNKDGKLNAPMPVKMAIWDAAGKQFVTAEVPVTATADNGTFLSPSSR